MKHLKIDKYKGLPVWGQSLKQKPMIHRIILFLFGIGLIGCSDFVEVGPPKNVLISETVFNDPATVESALANLFYGMREEGIVSGTLGLTTALGIYGDELDYYGFNADDAQLFNHNLLASNNRILVWWNQAYHLIYAANDIIKGVGNSDILTPDEKKKFEGQALFVRAYVHSLLVSLYGDIPYVKSTDYLENNTVSRISVTAAYENIITDLNDAVVLLKDVESASSERVLPDQWAARALLARIYLYTENWELAASLATELIGTFSLEPDSNDVFLKESSETIWQLKAGEFPKNTEEAIQLIIQTVPGQTYALTDDLLSAFEIGDLRKTHWTDSISDSEGSITLQFAFKYKANLSETESLEYSILFRLAEQYFIRAEARGHLGDIAGAQQDLNTIRNRAGLANTTANAVDAILDAVLRERRVELFAEQGHRWFDLKRTGRADEAIGTLKSNWEATDVLLPVPEAELELNPNLLPQNNGY